jgi:hypothetical protein
LGKRPSNDEGTAGAVENRHGIFPGNVAEQPRPGFFWKNT